MNLDYTSRNARLYRWFYCEDIMPKDGCYYVKKLLLAWFLAGPFTLYILPVLIFKNADEHTIGARIGVSTAMWVTLYFLFCMLFAFSIFFIGIIPNGQDWHLPQIVGLIFWGLLIGIFLVTIVEKLVKVLSKKSTKKESSNLIVEYYKAVKNKYCPQLEWFNDPFKPESVEPITEEIE